MLMENCELTTEFIVNQLHTAEASHGAALAKTAKKREKPREFFSFFIDAMPSEARSGRDEIRARQLVADTIARSRDRLKACGIKETTVCPDLLQQRPLQIDAIASICAVYSLNCIILLGKLAFKFAWGTDDVSKSWLVLERQGANKYVTSKLSPSYIQENYIVTTSATKVLSGISKYTAAEVKRMWKLCEFGSEEPRTKKQAFDALSAYVNQRTKSAN